MVTVTIIVTVLIIVLLIVNFNDKKHGSRTFKSEITAIDTTEIISIEIKTLRDTNTIVLKKEQNSWYVNIDTKLVSADNQAITGLISQISNLKTKQVVANNNTKWANFDVTDSTGTQVVINGKKKELANLIVGKFDYNPQMRSVSSHVRVPGDNNVYVVDGYLSMMVNRAAETFISHTILPNNIDKWNKLVFNYPADSSFVLQKQSGKWLVNGIAADSATVSSFIGSINGLTAQNINTNTNISLMQPLYTLRVETDDAGTIDVLAYKADTNMLVTSSINKGNILFDNQLVQKLFIGKNYFAHQ